VVEQHEEIVRGSDRLIGTIFAEQYEILAALGRGGIGAVYKARQLSLDRIVAVKILHDMTALATSSLSRFQREAAVLERLSHPNIVNFFQFGVTPEGTPFVVLEYLDGKDLDTLLKSEQFFEFEKCWQLFDQMLDAMATAHAAGIVHRDLKPSNVVIIGAPDTVRDSKVKILDFGLAKLLEDGGDGQKVTRTGSLLGTPLYMSPEQASGKAATVQSDIYAIGCIMYECLTGRAPFAGETFYSVLMQHMETEPPTMRKPDGTPIDLSVSSLVMKALSKDADERYASAVEFQQALRTLATTGKLPGNRSRRRPQRATVPWAKVGSYLLIAVSLTAIAISAIMLMQPRLGHRYDLKAAGKKAVQLCNDRNYPEMKSVLESALDHLTEPSKAQLEPYLVDCVDTISYRFANSVFTSIDTKQPAALIPDGEWVLDKFIYLPPGSRQNQGLAVDSCFVLATLNCMAPVKFKGLVVGGQLDRAESYFAKGLQICAAENIDGKPFQSLLYLAPEIIKARLQSAEQAANAASRESLLNKAEVTAKQLVESFSHSTVNTFALRPARLQAYHILGGICEQKRNYSEALANYRKAAAFSIADCGGDAKKTQSIRSFLNQNIVLCEISLGNQAAALAYTAKLLEEQNAPPSKRANDPAEALWLHGWALFANGQLQESEEYFNRGLKASLVDTDSRVRIFTLERVIASTLRRQGRFVDAERYGQTSLQGFRSLSLRVDSAEIRSGLEVGEDELSKIKAHKTD